MTARKGCFLSAAAALIILVTIRACGPTPPEEVTKKFPIGSRLIDLDTYLDQTNLADGVVYAWQATPDIGTANKIQTDFGTFKKLESVPYDNWKATQADRDKFTGEILVFESRFTYTYMVGLYYRDGKLWKADWGFLPG